MLNLFYTNCRSAKAKSCELSALSSGYDIVCLTETHVDCSINSRTIIDRDDLLFFRKDRNLYGGGVLIAINQNLQPERINIQPGDEELVLVKINNNIVIVCYYRPNHGDSISGFVDVMSKLFDKHPCDHIVIVGDFNFPGYDWQSASIKQNCQYKTLHKDFLAFLEEHNLSQIIDEPTHVKGNTLDLACSTQPLRLSAQVISPGVSDHFIISVEFRYESSQKQRNGHQIKLYHKADVDKFQNSLRQTQNDLANMTNVNNMWNVFVDELKIAINTSVPVKQIRSKNMSEPIWFTRSASRIVRKQRRTYNKHKTTGNPFFKNKYEEERRKGKKQLATIKQSYIENRICKPLESGNSKPFYKHLKRVQNSAKPPLKLSNPDGTLTDDPKECATLLNTFFSKQFCALHQITDGPNYNVNNTNLIEISPEGIMKLLYELKYGKAAGSDGIQKEDFLVDPITTAPLSHSYI